MIDKIAALRKIAYGGTPPPPPRTFYSMKPPPQFPDGGVLDMQGSTNQPPVSVQPKAKMPPWMKRIVDRLPEGGNPFDRIGRTIPNKAPPGGNPYDGSGRSYSDALWRTPEEQGRYDRGRDMRE